MIKKDNLWINLVLQLEKLPILLGRLLKKVVEQASIFSTNPSPHKPNGKMLLPKEAVLYFFAVDSVDDEKISFKTKVSLWKTIRQLKEPVDELEVIGKRFFLNSKARDKWKKLEIIFGNVQNTLKKKPEIFYTLK